MVARPYIKIAKWCDHVLYDLRLHRWACFAEVTDCSFEQILVANLWKYCPVCGKKKPRGYVG